MKILIGHSGTKLFVRDCNQWTSDRDAAKDFGESSDAHKFIRQHQLNSVEIVLSFPHEGYDIRLAISAPLSNRRNGRLAERA
jgi:hypothetical protein